MFVHIQVLWLHFTSCFVHSPLLDSRTVRPAHAAQRMPYIDSTLARHDIDANSILVSCLADRFRHRLDNVRHVQGSMSLHRNLCGGFESCPYSPGRFPPRPESAQSHRAMHRHRLFLETVPGIRDHTACSQHGFWQ